MCLNLHVCVLSHFSPVGVFGTLWTKSHQASPSVGFSRQEHWSGLLCLHPGGSSWPRARTPPFLMSLASAARFFTTSTIWKAQCLNLLGAKSIKPCRKMEENISGWRNTCKGPWARMNLAYHERKSQWAWESVERNEIGKNSSWGIWPTCFFFVLFCFVSFLRQKRSTDHTHTTDKNPNCTIHNPFYQNWIKTAKALSKKKVSATYSYVI